ncbi:hypothetical protein [Bordetella genomosp. 13]|uniref:hypothetical protein n=1 Tax=Bordetella genomosp. 13 TaxID=463040 RepID=UPI0011A4A604|nr:hypothetical protein [Bordetella genomosp. 13]
MYRLPTQFDPAGRQDDLSAAGGGSTSTTCSSCVLTLGAFSTVTAMMFVGLAPPPNAAARRPEGEPDGLDVPPDPPAGTAHAREGAGAMPPSRIPDSNLPAAPMSAGKRGTLGAVSLLIALAAGVACAFVHPMFGVLAFLGSYVAIYCTVYERSNLSAARGAGIGILMLVAIVICGLFEMYVWMQNL